MSEMERVLYFDCFSGVAGDMTLGALIDLGLDPDELVLALRSLELNADWSLTVERVHKMGIVGCKVRILVEGEEEGAAEPVGAPIPGLVSLRAVSRPATHAFALKPAQAHRHGPGHGHRHGYRAAEILKLIDDAVALPLPVRTRARQAFSALAQAEAEVHGVSAADVHFHEVGAIDSILDIVGSAWGIWRLGVDVLESAPPPLGRGFFRTEHGRMPGPAPATLKLLEGLPITAAGLDRELVTPTGAAFLKAWCTRIGDLPDLVLERVGFGAGNADFPDRPNLLRLLLGRRRVAVSPDGELWVIEVNLDDLSPEIGGYVLERLLEAGARDAWFTPLYMKKNRPGFLVSALVDEARRSEIESVILRESTAIGLRRHRVTRTILERRIETVSTPYGDVRVKVALDGEALRNVAPEFEDCAARAREAGVALKEVYRQAIVSFSSKVPQ